VIAIQSNIRVLFEIFTVAIGIITMR